MLCQAVAKAYGAKKVIGVDVVQSRLDFARSFGADGTYFPPKPEQGSDPVQHSEKVAELIKKEFDLGEGPDIVIEATGAEACMTMATASLFACSRKLTVGCRYSGGCQFDEERRCKHDLHPVSGSHSTQLTFE